MQAKPTLSRTSYVTLAIALGALTAIPPISIDTQLPAMPAMAAGLGTTPVTIQLTISAYVFGAAIGQILLAPLSDRFGRKPMLFAGMAAYVIAAAGCVLAQSVEMLAVMRFIQGMSTFAGRILPRAMVRDLYDREDAAKLLSYMAMVGGLAPIAAPLIGAFLSESYGWRSTFAFMATYGLVMLVLVFWLIEETLPKSRRIKIRPAAMISNFAIQFRNRAFVAYTLCVLFNMAGLMTFLVSASSIVILYLGLSPKIFAIGMACVMTGYATGAFIAGRLVNRYGLDHLIAAGALLSALSGLTMLVLALSGVNTIWAVMAPMFTYMISFSLIVPQAMAGALSPFGAMAGSAMSNLGFVQTCTSALIAAVVGLLYDGTQMPMVWIMALAGVCTLLAYLFLVRPLAKSSANG
jgi:DHA1 family bicyclomycin/chloramphenicol resistance-like MFS transporter